MASLNLLSGRSREWRARAERCQRMLTEAASLQMRQRDEQEPLHIAESLVTKYHIRQKGLSWKEYGDLALHLAYAWPADLSYYVLYSLREIKPPLKHDVIPYVMKAIEMLQYLNPSAVTIHITTEDERRRALESEPAERAETAAKIIVREISCTPLQWAAGIFRGLDPGMKPYVAEELRKYNAKGAEVLLKDDWTWLLTVPGLMQLMRKTRRFILRMFFGKTPE